MYSPLYIAMHRLHVCLWEEKFLSRLYSVFLQPGERRGEAAVGLRQGGRWTVAQNQGHKVSAVGGGEIQQVIDRCTFHLDKKAHFGEY